MAVSAILRRRRSPKRAVVAALLAAAQFGVVALAPVIDAREGPSAPSHVEEFGISIHYSHNPDDCAACAASTLIGDLPRALAAVIPASVRSAPRPAIRVAPSVRRTVTPKSPRAPPDSPSRER